MLAEMNKYIPLTLLIILFASLGVYLKFKDNLDKTPIGCDEFGYMQLAKAMDEGKAFKEHAPRPYLPDLLNYLRENGISETELRWTLVPHAYYVVDGTHKVINQYAPGTSFLMSLFPIATRKLHFSALAVVLLIGVPFLAMYFIDKKKQFNYAHLALLVFALYSTLGPPLLAELTRVNSVVYTIGFLITAGYFLKSNPLLACFLIALTANFRQVNLLLLLPLPLFFDLSLPASKTEIKNWFKQAFKAIGLLLIALSPYFYYMFKLMGNPFKLTYSSIDTKTTTAFLENIKFYFNPNEAWFWLNLLMVTMVSVLYIYKQIKFKEWIGLLFFEIVTYAFFLGHSMQINYYPYACAIVLLGFGLNQLSRLKLNIKETNLIPWLTLAIAILMAIDGYFNQQKSLEVKTADAKYQSLCNFQIVWGDLLPSASEYVCNNNAFKFAVTTPRTRKLVINYLYKNKLNQVFITKDIPMESTALINELKSLNLPFTLQSDSIFGSLILLETNE